MCDARVMGHVAGKPGRRGTMAVLAVATAPPTSAGASGQVFALV